MDLTPDVKQRIDAMLYRDLLSRLRSAPAGDPIFHGESGRYFGKRLDELRAAGADHVDASKAIGWDR